MTNRNLSHFPYHTLESAIEEVRERLRFINPDLLERGLDLLRQLSEFDLGRFLLTHRGLNGFWTDYIVLYPHRIQHRDATPSSHPLEAWLLTRCPAFLATQERFRIFQVQLKKFLRPGFCAASIPCGLMADLLTLPIEKGVSLTWYGVDLDSESLQMAQERSGHLDPLRVRCEWLRSDAWELPHLESFELITSNGLNIYEPDDHRVVRLYQQFHRALKPGGILVTSFLVPPGNSEDPDRKLQKFIFSDLLAIKWQVFRDQDRQQQLLENAGFKVVEYIYDTARLFPTVVAKK